MANVPPGDARYLALTTYRRDGRPVTTPVWAAPLGGKLYVVTAKSTGKARGVRATGRVRFAASNMSGRQILSEWQATIEGIGPQTPARLVATFGDFRRDAEVAARRLQRGHPSSSVRPPPGRRGGPAVRNRLAACDGIS
jgi:hypothetical protein